MSADEWVVVRSSEPGVRSTDVRGPSRLRELVNARITIAGDLRRVFSMSLPAIARCLGRRNHTSALWWLRGGKRKP